MGGRAFRGKTAHSRREAHTRTDIICSKGIEDIPCLQRESSLANNGHDAEGP